MKRSFFIALFLTLILLTGFQGYSITFLAMSKRLLEKSPDILLKKLEYESLLSKNNNKEDESKTLNAELAFNRAKCQELKKLISIVYDYNISQLETQKYILLINLKMISKNTPNLVTEPLEILKYRLKSLEEKRESFIKSLKILLDLENVESPGLIGAENIDLSLAFLDESSLLSMSIEKRVLETEKTGSIQEILEVSIAERNLRLKLVDYFFKMKESFNLLNLYKSIHSEFSGKIEQIEEKYKAKEISNEDYIKSQLNFVDLKLKLLSQEKEFAINYLNLIELLGLDVVKYFMKDTARW